MFERIGNGAKAGIDVVVLKRPNTGGRILGYGLGILGDLVPALAEARVLKKGHRGGCRRYDVANINGPSDVAWNDGERLGWLIDVKGRS